VEIEYKKEALENLKGYSRPIREQILNDINGLIQNPPVGDIKPLTDRENEYRLRSGKYRIIYEYIFKNREKILLIIKVDSRGNIYKQ